MQQLNPIDHRPSAALGALHQDDYGRSSSAMGFGSELRPPIITSLDLSACVIRNNAFRIHQIVPSVSISNVYSLQKLYTLQTEFIYTKL